MDFHFTGFMNADENNTFTVTVTGTSVLEAALAAGSQIRAHFASNAAMTVLRVDAPAPVVTDEHAATRAEGRRLGMTEDQIHRFIARMAA